jgi:hypothetical protein
MLNYLDILDRAHNGPYISEESWDLDRIAMTTKRLVKKYKLEWDRNNIVTDDPSLSECIFKAGYELAVEVGAYSRSTELIIQISQEEIDEGIRNMPQTIVMGEGKDARTLYARHLDDERAPLFFGGSPGSCRPVASCNTCARVSSASAAPGWACWQRSRAYPNWAIWPRRTQITCARAILILCRCLMS